MRTHTRTHAHTQVLNHPWMRENGAAPDEAFVPEILIRMRQFTKVCVGSRAFGCVSLAKEHKGRQHVSVRVNCVWVNFTKLSIRGLAYVYVRK